MSKTFRVTAKNFQSWKNFSLKVKGFTVIIGPSDRGKSAIIRALRGILRNEVGAPHIRFGEKEASVSLEFEGEDSIELTRNSRTTTYKVGDEEFSKLAGGVPPAIAELRCNTVDVNGVKLDPIFASQFDQQFMLTMSPAELNSIFGLFSSTERLNAGKKAAAAKNVEFNSNAKFLANEILEAENKVNEISPILLDFNELETVLEHQASDIEAINKSAASLISLVSSKKQYAELVNIATSPIPSISTVEKLSKEFDLLRVFVKSKKLIESLLAAIGFEIPSFEDLSNTLSMGKSVSAFIKRKGNLANLQEAAKIKLETANTLLDTTKVIQELKGLVTAKIRVASLSLPDLDTDILETRKTSIDKLKSSYNDVFNYIKVIKEIKLIKEQSKDIKDQYKTVSRDISKLKIDAVECPECGHFFQLGELHGSH